MVKLCNNNKDTNLRFCVRTKRDKIINQIQTTVAQIEAGDQKFEANAGSEVEIKGFELVGKPNFLDYLKGGWSISVVGAIDYTASNGSKNSSSSLHYLGAQKNQYE